MRVRLLPLVCVIVILFGSTFARVASADNLSGAWTMVKYEGPATHGTASGQILFADGHFSLTYVMDDKGQKSGRAHAGTYTVSGDKLTYHVKWTFQYAEGKGSVGEKESDRDTKFALNGDTLVITFSNGSVQTFKRAH